MRDNFFTKLQNKHLYPSPLWHCFYFLQEHFVQMYEHWHVQGITASQTLINL